MKKPVIHFWVPYPLGLAPSQRFRVELFLPALKQQEFRYQLFAFLDKQTADIFYHPGKRGLKTVGIIKGFLRRVVHLFISMKADFILIHREASPVGPPIFEWILSKIFRKRIIYQFDDAIWIPGGEEASLIKKWLKATWKVKFVIKWSYKVVGGNEFLCKYARQFNEKVILIPTVLDTESGHHKLRDQRLGDRIVVGWTGSHTTLHNLEEIEKLLGEMKNDLDFDILIISNQPPDWNFDFIYKKWNAETELEDLLGMHIGIMPLKQGPWFEGKCGFKLIQYHACGIPAVASPVGVNSQITLHWKTGFIANSKMEWKTYLNKLIQETELRIKMGLTGREHIEKNYSLNNHLLSFISLFS